MPARCIRRLARRLFAHRAAAALLALVACSPVYDWREVRLADAPLVALFPCRPDHVSRPVQLAGARLQMRLASCQAAGTTFALSHVELADAAQGEPALRSMRDAAVGNIGGVARTVAPLKVAGAASGLPAQRVELVGKRPDGSVIRLQAGWFAAGLHVYQASAVGSVLDLDAVDAFFGGLALPP